MPCAWALWLLIGCSPATAPGPEAGSPLTEDDVATAAACRPPVPAIDKVAGILVAPITGAASVAGDSQSCEYTTAGFPAITISVRPGVGQGAVDAWLTGKMGLKVIPLPDVGDAAVWQDSLHEVIAQKHDLLCDIQVRGSAEDIVLSGMLLSAALGSLCNAVFTGV